MDKLVITVTVDSIGSYPGNHYCPPYNDIDKVGEEYVRAVNAGASVVHLHGARELDPDIQPDGRRTSRLLPEGWRTLVEKISASCRPVIQFGVAAARFPQRAQLFDLKPDMISVPFNSHDEHFHPDPSYPPYEVLALHPAEELRTYTRATREVGIKMEIEAFHTGAFWNIELMRRERLLLDETLWISLFFGWPGGSWTPSNPRGMLYLTDNLPANSNWNMSCMHPPSFWGMLALAISMGGHVRVGWEDNPYLEDGTLAPTNALLVEKTVRIARELGREVATPDEARRIIGLRKAVRP